MMNGEQWLMDNDPEETCSVNGIVFSSWEEIQDYAKKYNAHMQAYINNEHAKIINAADTLAQKALDYADAGKAIRYGDVVEAAREYRRVRGE